MTVKQLQTLKDHFLGWSGGFEPESPFEITVYVDYARDVRLDAEEVRQALLDWVREADELDPHSP